MDVNVRGNGVTVSEDLREFARERASRLDRLVKTVDTANIELRHNHTKTGPDTITAQFTIQSGPTVLRAEERDPDVKLAIDRAAAKIEQQVRKVHSKRARRKGAAVETIRGADVLVAPDLAGLDLDTLDSEDQPAPQVRVKRFAMKPMHLDEAIEQMELLGHDFFLFRNADTGHSAVVYQRANGDYGLIMDDNA